jgi:hypothetical protein
MNHILTTIGLLFIVISSVFLVASYLCITGSNYIETFKNDYGVHCDYTDIQESLIDFIQSSKDTIYYYFGIIYNNDVFIKQEHMEEDSSDSDLEYWSDSDIEDVTEQILLEKEMNKIIVDLSSEDIPHTPEILNELGANIMEDIITEIENTESDSEEANEDSNENSEDSNENSEDSNENSEDANEYSEDANEDSEDANEDSEDANEDSEDANEEESSQMVQRTLRSTKK